jgi:hypothetical protein
MKINDPKVTAEVEAALARYDAETRRRIQFA